MDYSMVNLSTLGAARSAYGVEGRAHVPRQEKKDVPASSFEGILKESLRSVNEVQIAAEDSMKAMATGDVDDISEVAAAVSEADLALNLAVQIRDKLVDAYNQLSRISV